MFIIEYKQPQDSHMAKLDTYQRLVVDAINEYGTGDWKNWMSVHYVHESGYSNICLLYTSPSPRDEL